MEKGIYGKVIEVATNKLSGKYNLVQFKALKPKAMAHKNACEQAVAFAKENPLMPFYAVLAMGINANAFKTSEFNKGYKSFDAEKAKTCFEMAKLYNEKMGIKGRPSDITWNLVSKFYTKARPNAPVAPVTKLFIRSSPQISFRHTILLTTPTYPWMIRTTFIETVSST